MRTHELASIPVRGAAGAARRWLAGLVLMIASLPGLAANSFVATHEAALDEIFGTRNFGATTIDIRFNDWQTVVAPGLLVIDSGSDFDGPNPSLSFFASSLPSLTIGVFFVDSITSCGDPLRTIVGCGSSPGDVIALQSAFAAGSRGAILLAHELGHNLDLDHFADADNVMNATLVGGDDFNEGQVRTMLRSPLIQFDGGQRYLSVTPFAVVAVIPEPHTWMMMGLGLIGVAGWARRRRTCAG